MSWDPYLDLTSGVLRNRLGITDRAELARVEAALTAARIYDLQLSPLPGRYDLDHLRACHYRIFSDIYDWAGELRTVALGRGALFCPPGDLVRVGSAIFADLAAADYLRGMRRPAFVDRLTELLAAINSLHPFRDGNGRAQRAFLAQLAHEAGHPIRWQTMDPEVNMAASRAAHHGDNMLLRAMLDDLVAASRTRPLDRSS